MYNKRNLWISLLAAIASGLLVYGVYVLQLRHVRDQETVSVVAAKDFVPAGTLLTADLVEEIPFPAGSLMTDMVQRANEVVGRETAVPLGTGEPILGWKLNRYGLLPNANQATFEIPKEYVLSLPGGVRAGDRVKLYVSGKDISSKLLPDGVVVASVKSSGNVEIDDPKNPNLLSKVNGDTAKMYASRREANGAIDRISLNLTESEWFMVDEACRNKLAKLVIAFDGESMFERGNDHERLE